ncbi:hypothetical protein K6Y31_11340 [Motilimonas cestriensis]|uniref:Uncharacterized protein n=1 Tax=Motilimonas cestriensis TaxID=2742685 RepID=A0ABS8WAW4_9GAMM|nr:hypothetical protein [Motilimonas cestriensis]MCE2595410.1 hypothetical protein [Motilimonas cestriensis]
MTVKVAPRLPDSVEKSHVIGSFEDEKVESNQSKRDLQAYLENLLEDVFSQLPGS